MLDTGSEINVIKLSVLDPLQRIDTETIIKVTGISRDPVFTKGTALIKTFGTQVQFHIVSDEFPISQGGILGSEFLQENRVLVNYQKETLVCGGREIPFVTPETIQVPARSVISTYVKVANHNLKEGYVPRLNLQDGLYAGDALIRNMNGKALLRIINTTTNDAEIPIPTLKLEKYETTRTACIGEALATESIPTGTAIVEPETENKSAAVILENESETEIPITEPENEPAIVLPDHESDLSEITVTLPESGTGPAAIVPELEPGIWTAITEPGNKKKLAVITDTESVSKSEPELVVPVHESESELVVPVSEPVSEPENEPAIVLPDHEPDLSEITATLPESGTGPAAIVPEFEPGIWTAITEPGNKKKLAVITDTESVSESVPELVVPVSETEPESELIVPEPESVFKSESKLFVPASESEPEAEPTTVINSVKPTLTATVSQRANKPRPARKMFIVTANNSPGTNDKLEEELDYRARQVTALLRLEHLNAEEAQSIKRLIYRSADRFHLPMETLGATSVIKHGIVTTDQTPVHVKQYRFPPVHKSEIDNQTTSLLKDGIIEQSLSPYNSPIWIVPKKADSHGNRRWRMVIDYRKLNEKTVGDAYPLPNIIEILDQLGSAKYFSVFDLASGFHQIPVEPADAHKTAFSTPFGHYQFTRMPFGLKNAPATFQRLMDHVLTGMQGAELFVYLDDIIIYARSLREHEIKYQKLITRLRAANLKLQPDKCEFLRKEITYLGHIIGEDGVKPDPKKLEAVRNFTRPTNPKQIKQFLGLVGYYRRFIPGFAKIARPLTQLLKKDAPFAWGPQQENGFCILRDHLLKEPILQYPNFEKPFNITTDASGYAIAAILSQGPIGKDLPIAYCSRLLNQAEQNYSTIEKELLAIVYAVQYYRPYIYGNEFNLITDHKPLVWLNSIKDPTSRLTKWGLKLAEYTYKVIYKPGTANINVDALSRNPTGQYAAIQVISKGMGDSSDESLYSFPPRPPIGTAERGEPGNRLNNFQDPQPNTEESSGITHESTLETTFRPEHTSTPGSSRKLITCPSPLARRFSMALTDSPGSSSPSEYVDESPPTLISNNLTLTETDPNEGTPNCPQSKNHGSPSLGFTTSQQDSDSEPENETTENLFSPVTVPYKLNDLSGRAANVLETRDNFLMRRDNLVVFVTQKGRPCDNGSKQLQEIGKLPKYPPLSLARGHVSKYGNKVLISLPVKEAESTPLDEAILDDALESLLDITRELGLHTISISKTDRIDSTPWAHIHKRLTAYFDQAECGVTVCLNLIQTPPIHRRNDLIEENHASALGGHKGVTKTYHRLRQRYYWTNMKEDIQVYIHNCMGCQRKKLVRIKGRQPMMLTDTPGSAFDKVALDIMGPLPITAQGNRYVLTAQDLLTKYLITVPLTNATSIDIADGLRKYLVSYFGSPRTILTDQGTNFTSSLMKALARKFRMKQIRTTAFHPQGNGSVERTHHVITEYLKQYTNQGNNWDEYLDLAMLSYNTSRHESTKFTPCELVMGKLARTPGSDPPVEGLDRTYHDYYTQLISQINRVQTMGRTNLNDSKVRSKHYYDRKARPHTIRKGDTVYLLKEPTTKFGDQYTGPHEVIGMCGPRNFSIRVGQRTRVVHADKLRKAKTRAFVPKDQTERRCQIMCRETIIEQWSSRTAIVEVSATCTNLRCHTSGGRCNVGTNRRRPGSFFPNESTRPRYLTLGARTTESQINSLL